MSQPKKIEVAPEHSRPLSREELRQQFEILRMQAEELQQQGQGTILLPEGFMLNGKDYGGKTMKAVLDDIASQIDYYESPVDVEMSEAVVAPESSDVPKWLEGYESLIWKGARTNPLWEAVATQYGNEVRVSYVRREKVLRPGKTRQEQDRTLEPVGDTFTADEWRVVKRVLDRYVQAEKDLEGGGSAAQEARALLLEVIREENYFKRGRTEEPPTHIAEALETALDDTVKSTRGFKRESVDTASLVQRTADLLSQLVILNRSRSDGRERLRTKKKGIKEVPTFEASLRKLTLAFGSQAEQGKGMSLIIGEAGTGKNELVEYFAASTNRPYFWFPCGKGMEAPDLVNHYEFDTKEGTQRFFTTLAQGLQTPGAVVFIDEVNALRPEVQAALHGLGDGNRALNFDGVYVPVAEDVLILIGGNPATYASAGNIGQALLNRTRGQSMVMEYPALTKGEILRRENGLTVDQLEMMEKSDNALRDIACDEALILYPSMPNFSGLSDAQFALLWDTVVNSHSELMPQVKSDPVLASLVDNQSARRALSDLQYILRVADAWRRRYEARDGFDIGLSIRDTIAVVRRYVETGDVRKAYLQTFDDFRKNPIADLDVTHENLRKLLDSVIPA